MPPFSPRRWIAVLTLLLAACCATRAAAENWRYLGISGPDNDKVYVDLQSVKPLGDLRVVTLNTVYPTPRVNIHGYLMDRHEQVTAIDCAHETAVGLRTEGFLNDKQVAVSPMTQDWHSKLVPIGNAPLNRAVMTIVCGSGSGAAPPAVMVGGDSQPNDGTAAQSHPAEGTAPVKASTGSGVIVNADGFVLTNVHVVRNCKLIAVKTVGVPLTPAVIEAADPKNDLALLRTRAGIGQPATFRNTSSPPRLGEDVGVIGYPLTGYLSSEPKATFGQVNSVAGVGDDYTLLQISAPVQPGNSGGPVLDAAGQVVGVVVSEASPVLAAKIGVMPQNVNFAIRGELAQIFMNAHGVRYNTGGSRRHMQTEDIASAGEASAAQVICVKNGS